MMSHSEKPRDGIHFRKDELMTSALGGERSPQISLEAIEPLVAEMCERGELDRRGIEKINAAKGALKLLADGMIVALGSGSTAEIFVRMLGRTLHAGLLRGVTCVGSSRSTEALAREYNIPLKNLNEIALAAVGVDGADEVAPEHTRYVLKGGGGCALRERLVADRCQRFVIIASSDKIRQRLGEKFRLPVDVQPERIDAAAQRLRALGAEDARLRCDNGRPFETDDKNVILDAQFGGIEDPQGLSQMLEAAEPDGIVNHGLFEMATDLILASETAIEHKVWTAGGWCREPDHGLVLLHKTA